MTLDVQFKLKTDPNYVKYLRENSYWYKILNRNPNNFKYFEEEVKKNYQLTIGDKIGKIYDATELLSSIVSMLK